MSPAMEPPTRLATAPLEAPPRKMAARGNPSSPSSSAPVGLPRLLTDIPAQGLMSLSEHVQVHGEPPLAHGRRERRAAGALIERIERAGLRGQGGASFPSAVKMRAVAASRGRAVVVVNAAEGEPASLKDRALLAALPHLVLDGPARCAGRRRSGDRALRPRLRCAEAPRAGDRRTPAAVRRCPASPPRHRPRPLHRWAGDRARLPSERRSGAADIRPPDALRTRRGQAPHAAAQRRDAGAGGAHSAPRVRLVPRVGHRR